MVTRHFERKKAQMSSATNNTGDEPKKKEDSDCEKDVDSEEELAQKSSKKEKNVTKSNVKLSAKKSNESEDENNDEDDEDNDEDEEKKPGLLDLPLEVSGARERKKVERLHLSFNVPGKEKKTDIPEGLGHRLGECPRIEMNLQKVKVDDLKLFHRLLFNRPGTPSEIKKNIKRFSGFLFAKDSPEFEKKRINIDKLTRPVLKQICEILDLERGGSKEDAVTRILEFLMKPTPSGKAVPKMKKKKSVLPSSSSKKSSKKKGAKNSKVKNAKKKSSDVDSGSNEDGDNSMDDENNDDEDAEDDRDDDRDATEDESEEERKSKKKEKKPPSKSRGRTVKKDDNKSSAKGGSRKRRIVSSDDDSSDDEPLMKKGKQQPPTDDELKSYIKSILDGANLEEITMKTVCKQVFSHYPDFDLSTRKEFIKSTVRSIIS